MRKHILCTLANASVLISGIAFAASEDPAGMLSVDPVDEADETVAAMLTVPGFEIHEVKAKGGEKAPAKTPEPKAAPAKPLTKAQKAAAKKAEKDAAEKPAETVPETDTDPAAGESPPTDPAAGDGDEQPAETATETVEGETGGEAASTD